MVKYIIKRILIGTGIALALMFIKGGLVANVYAMETSKLTPTRFCYNTVGSSSETCPTIDTFTSVPLGIDFMGKNLNVSTQTDISTFNWYIPANDLDLTTSVDIHFLLYYSGTFTQYDDNPLPVFIRQSSPTGPFSTISCNTTTPTSTNYTSTGATTLMGYYSTVSCTNVALNNTSFRIYVASSLVRLPTGSHYIGISRPTIYPHGTNQDVVNSINDNTDAVNDVNDTLNDNSTDDPTNDISSMNNKVASNNSITQLLTLPIQLYQNILNAVSGSCSSFSLGSLYGHNLTLPCINLQSLLGSTLYGIIDILISGLFILSFRKKMVDIFNNMTSLKDRGNELE